MGNVRSGQLKSTGQAAAAIGVHRTTLGNWARDGKVTPAIVTPGGIALWNIPDLLAQLTITPEQIARVVEDTRP